MNSDTSKMSRGALLHQGSKILLLGTVLLLAIDLPARAAETVEQTESLHYEVAPDYSYKLMVVADRFVDKQAEVNDASHISYTYDPDRTAFHLVEGWVDGPDGHRHKPASDAIFTRPSAASHDAPGFVSSVTTTVVMPGVVKGSHVHYKAEETVRKLPLMGFNPIAWLSPFMIADERVVIDIPASLPLSVGSQGGFVVSDTTTNGMRHIVADASMRNVSTRDREPHMAPTEEFEPIFLATSLKSYEEAGAIYHRVNEGKATVTPDIEALARKIVGDRKGLDAARAIYDWIAKNIRYLAVYRNDDAGEESHDASTVLKNGYGDCKDHVTLMQSLLAAVGVRTEPALIDWSSRDKPLPIWSSRETNHAIVYLPDFDVFAGAYVAPGRRSSCAAHIAPSKGSAWSISSSTFFPDMAEKSYAAVEAGTILIMRIGGRQLRLSAVRPQSSDRYCAGLRYGPDPVWQPLRRLRRQPGSRWHRRLGPRTHSRCLSRFR